MLNLDAIEQFKSLAAARGPLLIATDLDGTLAPIVPTPARRASTGCTRLESLSAGAKVAVSRPRPEHRAPHGPGRRGRCGGQPWPRSILR